jgi:hypothetical protein
LVGTITIDQRFHGPPHSGNGGYTCGLVAAQLDEQMTVALRSPPPLDTPLHVNAPDEHGVVTVYDRDVLVATATPAAPVRSEPPAHVDAATATAAIEDYWGFTHDHIFPTCWVCGPDRAPGDGLRLFTGAVPDAPDNLVAAPWTPREDLDDGTGHVAPEHVWAALDCPSFFGLGAELPTAVLGSLTVTEHAPVRIGDVHVVLGWTRAPKHGRRFAGASAITTSDGELVASGEATWVELSPEVAARMGVSPSR